MTESISIRKSFDLAGRIAVITGGAGFLGVQHAEAIAEAGGIPILWDINGEAVITRAFEIAEKFNIRCRGMRVDITDPRAVCEAMDNVLKTHNRIEILINNAAHDPKVDSGKGARWSRFENFSLDMWEKDITVGLTGAFICSQVIGTYMANHGGGVILNIASDLGVIAPDQRIYYQSNLPDDQQFTKPVSYSVIKHGIIGLTRFLATYWADKNVRVNALSPGGVYANQPDAFVVKLSGLIPMGRMAHKGEYKGAIIFLCADASSYMTGANLIIDGGRTCW